MKNEEEPISMKTKEELNALKEKLSHEEFPKNPEK